MTNKELKLKIETNTLDDSLLILKYSDNTYICDEYVREICRKKNLERIRITNLNEMDSAGDLFDDTPKNLFVLYADVIDFDISPDIKNLVVICKEIKADLKTDYIDMTKQLNWQIEDYVAMRLPGLDAVQISWLCSVCGYNVYRLDQECKKIEIFNKPSQKAIFENMNMDNAYADLTTLTIFNFTNALLKKDYNTIKDILSDLKTIDVEGSALPVILIRNFKNIIDIQLNPKNTYQTLGMTAKQYNAIKYNCNKFTQKQLIDIFEFLTEIDYRLKNGELTLKDAADHLTINNMLVDYITCNLLTIVNS